jgi:GNAT superfamily N-acetyltransferase
VSPNPSSSVQLIQVDEPVTRNAARSLVTEYLQWVANTAASNYGLSFDVEAMVHSDLDDKEKFFSPNGRFYVLRHQGEFVGVGCLKRLAASVAEVQRMYVQPHVRGVGAGRHLVERLLADARAIGYQAVRLESLRVLAPAHALYRSVGFVEIEPYTENSMQAYQSPQELERYRASAVFMEARLGEVKRDV